MTRSQGADASAIYTTSSKPCSGKLIPNQSVLAFNGTHLALQNRMSLIPKTKQALESGSGILSKLFILNNMAERVGFEFSL
jgi:hypothetical protein